MIGVKRGFAAAVAALPLAALVGAGCGGYSEEDATTFCNQERTAVPACYDDAVYDACVRCYEECGSACAHAGSCPESYRCRDD